MSNFENSPCRLIGNLLIFSGEKGCLPIHVGLLMFHRCISPLKNVTNRIFFGLAKREMSCKKADAKAARKSVSEKEESSNIHAINNLFTE